LASTIVPITRRKIQVVIACRKLQVEAKTLVDRVAVLNADQIMQVGTPLERYDRQAFRLLPCLFRPESIDASGGAGKIISDLSSSRAIFSREQ
jgi:hypothetical protein